MNEPLLRICRTCGADNRPIARLCDQCGAELAAPESVSRLSADRIADLYRGGVLAARLLDRPIR